MSENNNDGCLHVYSQEFLLKFQGVPAKPELAELFVERHPCLRKFRECKFGDRCALKDLPRSACLQCLRGESHTQCDGTKPEMHPCIRVWGACRFGDGCKFKTAPRIWCLFCLRGAEHSKCSGMKPHSIPEDSKLDIPTKRSNSRSPFHTPDNTPPPSPGALPHRIENPFGVGSHEEEDSKLKVLKKLNGVMNRLTPEKFDKLLEQYMDFLIPVMQSKDADEASSDEFLQKAAHQLHEKAISEKLHIAMYASFAVQVIDELKKLETDHSRIFYNHIMQNCHDSFYALTPHLDIKQEEEEIVNKFRQRAQGNILFIAELYLNGYFKDTILMSTTHKLLKRFPDKEYGEQIELLCDLVTIVGKQLQTTQKNELNALFQQLNQLPRDQFSSRVNFKIDDLNELRNNGWVPFLEKEHPMLLSEVEAAMEKKRTERHNPF